MKPSLTLKNPDFFYIFAHFYAESQINSSIFISWCKTGPTYYVSNRSNVESCVHTNIKWNV